MKTLCALALTLISVSAAQAQSLVGKSIEGFWQDIAGRIVFKHNATAADKYGDWYPRALDTTYPQAKLIQRTGSTYSIVDLNYDDKEYVVKVLRADASHMDYVRESASPPCRMNHACRLSGDEMLCELEYVCQAQGKDFVDWRGEERYIRRKSCERDGKAQMQGIPVRCR